MTKNKNNLLLLSLITLLGLVLRFWQLDKSPVSLNWDEVSHGYNAYSILTTGKDEWGISFPLIFRAFGDYKLPVYIYLTVIPVFLFGLTAFAVRFISALAGVVAIPLIYFLTRQFFSDHKLVVSKRCSFDISLIAALLIALSPWHFFISRPALEANLALTLTIAGVLFLFLALKKSVYYLPSAFFFGLALHTYYTARVSVPLLILAFILFYRRQIKINLASVLGLILFVCSFAIVINQVAVGSGTARYQKIAILSPSTIFQIGEDRAHSRLPAPLARLVHNKLAFFASSYLKNYLYYFSPTFFNQSHGVQTQFAIPNQNLFTIPVLFLAIIGFLLTVKNNRVGQNRYLLAWLLIAPAAGAATIDPQALRPNLLIPIVIIFAAFGLVRVTAWLKKPFIILFSLLFIYLFFNYLKLYFGDYQKNYSAAWQYGNREAIEFINKNITSYDRVIMTKRYGEPHIFYAFYNRLDPKLLFPGPDNIRFMKSDWFWTDKIGKIYFVNDWQIGTAEVNSLPLESGGSVSTKNALLVTSPDHVPANTTRIQSLDFLNGDPAFVLAKFN